MNDKDSPLDGLFNGEQQIIVFPHDAPEDAALLGEVISDNLEFTPSQDEEDIEVNRGVLNGRITFTFNGGTISNSDTMTKLLGIAPMQNPIAAAVAVEPVQFINRPKNLKYPNKKRAKRIWKKWKKRFGVRVEKYLYIPKAEIVRNVDYDDDGSIIINTHITAKECLWING